MMKDRYNYPRSRRDRTYSGKPNKRTAGIIAKHLRQLKIMTCEGVRICCHGQTEEDVFSDTIIHVIHESNLEALSEAEVIAHFCHRFKMIQFQTVKDSSYIKEHLSNGIHTQEEEE